MNPAPATERVWQRLSPRMLVVHPVHDVLRQIPLLIGAVVLGSATGNPMWSVAALAVTIGFGILRWFTTTYRIEPDEVQLRPAAQGCVGAAQQDSFSSDRRPVAAPAYGVDGVAGQHRAGSHGRHGVRT